MARKTEGVAFLWSALGLSTILMSACAEPGKKDPPKTSSAAASAVAAAPATPAPLLAPKGPLTALWGTLEAVDGDKLTVKDKHGRQRTFRVASNATITRGGDVAPADLADARPGERLTVKYAQDVAASVHINVPAAR